MSRQRALRRAEREELLEKQRTERDQRSARVARRAETVSGWRARLPRRIRRRGQQGLLARRRRAQNALILGIYLVVQAVVWLIWSDPWVRVASAIFGVLATPVLVTLAFDRRARP